MTSPPVLHALAWPGEVSGAFRSMEESLAALQAAGVEARGWLALGNRFGEQPAALRLENRGIPFESRGAEIWFAPRAVASLHRALRRLGPGGILHTHGERALLWGRAAARAAGAAHVHTQHGFVADDARGRLRVGLGQRLTGGLSALVAVDPATSAGPVEARVIANTLDGEAFRQEAEDRAVTRRRLGLSEGAPCVLFLGRLSPEKGADLLALIQARLQATSGAARLIVAGAGPLASGVEAMTDVRLLGARSDAASLLAAADVVLMPSRSEGLPMVALESAAIGTPLVAFPAGGLADSGLARCVPMEDVDRMVATGLELVRNPGARNEFLSGARTVLEQRFGPSQHAALLVELYESL